MKGVNEACFDKIIDILKTDFKAMETDEGVADCHFFAGLTRGKDSTDGLDCGIALGVEGSMTDISYMLHRVMASDPNIAIAIFGAVCIKMGTMVRKSPILNVMVEIAFNQCKDIFLQKIRNKINEAKSKSDKESGGQGSMPDGGEVPVH